MTIDHYQFHYNQIIIIKFIKVFPFKIIKKIIIVINLNSINLKLYNFILNY